MSNQPSTYSIAHPRTTTEALLDWIEIRRVWWQEKKNLTTALNYFSKGVGLVNRAVVKNQDALVLRVGVHQRQLANGSVEI